MKITKTVQYEASVDEDELVQVALDDGDRNVENVEADEYSESVRIEITVTHDIPFDYLDWEEIPDGTTYEVVEAF